MLLMLITYPLGQSMQIYIDLLFFCWPPEGVSACSYASRPGRMTLCLAAIQTCFIYIPTTSASFSPDTWLEPSVSAQMREGLLLWSISLPVPKWQIDCKHAASCHFHTSTPCVFGSHTPNLSLLHPFCFWPSGVSVTPYMLRQLHSSPRYAQVCGHRLKGCVRWYGRWCKNTPASNCNAWKGMPESCIYSSVTEKIIIKCPTELLTGFPIFPSCSPDCSWKLLRVPALFVYVPLREISVAQFLIFKLLRVSFTLTQLEFWLFNCHSISHQ